MQRKSARVPDGGKQRSHETVLENATNKTLTLIILSAPPAEKHLKTPGRQVSNDRPVSLSPHSEKDGSAVRVSCTSGQRASCAVDAVARTEPDGTVQFCQGWGTGSDADKWTEE